MASNVTSGPSLSGYAVLKSRLITSDENFNVGHFNGRSINPSYSSGKLDEINTILKNNLLDVVGISETWLELCV